MLRYALRVLSVCAITAGISAVATAAEWGNLKGKFIYDGKPPKPQTLNVDKDVEVCAKHRPVDESLLVDVNGGLANVVIYVRDKKVKVHPDYEKTAKATVRFDNEHCRFVPHILPVRITQTLELHNSDPVGHNSNMQPLGDQGINPLLAPQSAATYKFNKAQTLPQPVTCNIHNWMKGYVLPRDNPYMAVSADDGTFEIKNLPVGELEIQVWQERAGYLEAKKDWKRGRFKLNIKPGENDLGTIKVNPTLFKFK
jgi:hypothetical protein